MIQRAHILEDKEEIIQLWQQCFCDSRDYIEFFLGNCPANNALFLYRNETCKVLGMMFLMPAAIVADSCVREVYYLYALAVDKESRGRGIAGNMLDYAGQFAAQKNAELCLVPGEESLRRFYAKRGFVDVFVCTEQRLPIIATDETYDGELICESVEVFADLQPDNENQEKNTFVWGELNYDFALLENKYCGGFAYRVKVVRDEEQYLDDSKGKLNGYIIGAVKENVLEVAQTNLKLAVIRSFALKYNCTEIHFLNIREPYEDVPMRTLPYAMMSNLSFTKDFIKDTFFYQRYINFCFD